MSNLLPQFQKQAITSLYRKRFSALVLMFVMCAALAGALLILPSFFLAKTNESALTEKKEMLDQQETSELQRSLVQSVGEINSRLAAFPEAQPNSPIVGEFVDKILGVQGGSVHISQFSYSFDRASGKVQYDVSGTADTRQALTAFADRIRNSGAFAEVTVPITSFIKDQNVTFTLTATRK